MAATTSSTSDHGLITSQKLEEAKQTWADCEKRKQEVRVEMKPLLEHMKQIKNDQSPHIEVLAEHMDMTGISEMAVEGWVIRRKSTKKKAFSEEYLNTHLDSAVVQTLKEQQETTTSMSITKATRPSSSGEKKSAEDKDGSNRKRRRVSN
jgi:hypothetical protein